MSLYSAKVFLGGEKRAMWYALRYENIQQKELAFSCLSKMTECSSAKVVRLTYDRLKRYQGEWHCERAELFSKHLVIDSSDKAQLKKKLHCSEIELTEISEKEQKLLCELCDKNGNIAMSQGVIRQGVTLVTNGPLKGKEDFIIKIDRHKRLATLKLPISAVPDIVSAGLEITEKTI